MKRLFALILLAIVTLAAVLPSARAHEGGWREPDQMLAQLNTGMHRIYGWRQQVGSTPLIQDQIHELRHGIDNLTYRVQNHAGDPLEARRNGQNLLTLMSGVNQEMHELGHSKGVVIEIYH